MRSKDVVRCERTGRVAGHCGCSDCYARRLAKVVADDKTLRMVSQTAEGYPRYLVPNSL